MSESNEHGAVRRSNHHIDPEASVHELLNDATEWLQYARGLSELLSDLVHESDTVDCRRLALSLEAIGALAHLAVQYTAQAHARLCWEHARPTSASDHSSDSPGPVR